MPDVRDGQMVSDLKKNIPGIEQHIIQFRLNDHKLDLLLNTLEMESDTYNNLCRSVYNKLKDCTNNKILLCQSTIEALTS